MDAVAAAVTVERCKSKMSGRVRDAKVKGVGLFLSGLTVETLVAGG